MRSSKRLSQYFVKKVEGDQRRSCKAITNNDRDRRIRDDDPLVQHEEVVTGRSAVKGIQRQPKKAPKTPELVESDDSDDEESDDAGDDEPMVKRIQTLPKKYQKHQMRNLQ